ncbi:4Fe-4S dicluster domain-containing protein [Anaerovirgula multivorans]|uniref:4Fe-4S dicluster domain-containing protein n=1 Tax=Anaerovirgula multivorans TaxID=312168 RepID=A0A239LM31_9FIRM|nr:4Fe-4S dicluster domain-containing protein [Anaerovirgula multivorans]
MKSAIIVFSPSGNTIQVGELLKVALEQNSINTQLINIAGKENYFLTEDKQVFLQEIVKEHDILFIGSPVYAHHLQYHVKDLIVSLPKPVNGWGKIAVPFITYGGINSGIALDEAGKLLRKSGRKVLAGLKVSSSHRMTRAFMKEEYNKNQPEDKTISFIEELIKRVKSVDMNSINDCSKHLKYQNIKMYLKAKIIFREKVWHEKRYPKVVIDNDKCIKCGKCINVCPVCHLKQNNDKSIERNINTQCIHCFNCILKCPLKAISPIGDLEKAKSFIESMIKKAKEDPGTCLYPKI